ncbi:glycosyltransferase [Pelagibius litoralis]|uniref:Glycosyltransferase n=1 Tax=Pelagibius litoralis TaxID=374515 RepID=A0A967C287_9PROT|nr:glycosyltransferase [Pelagibius litoralis]NIA69016.1 glycosyltransferase [Pelagibius litoralis]
MNRESLKVLTVSAADEGGGAEKIAMTLFRALRASDHMSWMAVGRRKKADPDIFTIPDTAWKEALLDWVSPAIAGRLGEARFRRALLQLTNPRFLLDRLRGREPFHYAGTMRLLDLPPERPDVLHCHNLHGGYFDLRELARLGSELPVVLTLHDEWTFTGHCAYTLGCERWRNGCGQCPHLDVYPAIRRDGSAANWAAKRAIFNSSRLYVATPSRWLMERVKDSVLANAIVEAKVIPNGIDLGVFKPGNRAEARHRLGLPADVLILLFTANRARVSPFKDYVTVRAAALEVARVLPQRRVLLLALGDAGPDEKVGDTEIRFVPYQSEEGTVASYYLAADVYLHAAHADNFPTTILEASACGLPVVATAVGGIPEQIDSLDYHGLREGAGSGDNAEKATGVLVPPGDSMAMAEAVRLLLEAPNLRTRLSRNAAERAQREWSEVRMVEAYLDWYRQILRA